MLLLQEVADDRVEELLAYYDSLEFEETLAEAGVREVLDAGADEEVHAMGR